MRYFAYCTLMDIDAMRVYCPSAQADGVVYLPDHELIFSTYDVGDPRGGCTFRWASGERLYGVVYDVPREEASYLQQKSGVAEGWYSMISVTLQREDDETEDAFTLVIPKNGDTFVPSASYVAPIARGARMIDLPPDYLAKLDTLITVAREGD